MKAHIEPQTMLIRVFDDGAGYGEPYTWICEAVLIEPGVIELRGAIRAPTIREWRAIKQAIYEAGYPLAIWRRADGRVSEVQSGCNGVTVLGDGRWRMRRNRNSISS